MEGYFDLELFATAIRTATPIAFAALGGLMCQRCGIFNIGLEGLMLIGAFGAMAGMQWFGGSFLLSLLTAILFSVVLSLIYALAIIKMNANAIVASISINLFGLGLTSYLMRVFFNATASFRPNNVPIATRIRIPVIEDIPIVGSLLSGQDFMVYLCIILLVVTEVILYKTHFGLKVRSIGEGAEIAEAAAINVNRIKLKVILWSAVFCGLGGAYMSAISIGQFTEAMIAGRGYSAFTAFVFGAADPLATFFVSLLLGFGEAVGIRFELLATGLSPYIVKCFPHVLALVALALSASMQMSRQKGRNIFKRTKAKKY